MNGSESDTAKDNALRSVYKSCLALCEICLPFGEDDWRARKRMEIEEQFK